MIRSFTIALTIFIVGLWGTAPGQTMSARDFFLMGSAKYKCNACSQAIEDFNQAIALKKDYPEALYGRSLAYLCISDYRAALKDIDAAIKLDPSQVLYLECKGRIRTQSGDLKGALSEFESTIARDSALWQAWYGLAVAAHGIKDTAKAMRAYSQAIRLQPDYAMAWFGRGNLRRESKQYLAALGDYSRGIELAPGFVPMLEARSLTNLQAGFPEAAQSDAELAIRMDASRAISHYYLGESKRLQGKYSLADFDYGMAVKLDKKMAKAYFHRGVCRDSIRDFKGARKYYTAAIAKDKQNAEAYVSRAHVWLKEANQKKAVADLGSALKITKDELPLYVERGFLYLDLLDYQSAIKDFQFVIKKSPEHAVALYGMGIAKYGIGNMNGACADWSKAWDLGEAKAMEQIKKNCVE